MALYKDILLEYGADYIGIKERFGDDINVYLSVLSMLPDDNNIATLSETLHNGRFDASFLAAHTLKGVSGNLGLTPLYKTVCAIVEPLRQKSPDADYPSLFYNICQEYVKAENMLALLSANLPNCN